MSNKKYPYNMLDDIFKYSIPKVTEYPEDSLASTEYVLHRMTERHREALILRYKEGKTLKEVGEHFGITPPGASVLINTALRAMKNGDYNKFLRVGIEGTMELTRVKTEEHYKKQIKKLRSKIEDHASVADRDMILENVDLSVRAYNRLKRAGCNTVRESIALGYEKLISLPGLGKQTYNEILFEFEIRGFDCTNIRFR